MKPVETVVKEIQEYEKYNKPYGAGLFRKSYYFVDDNLYVSREYVKKLFAAMAGLGIRWDGQGTMNTADDEEVVKLMAASGCRSFSVGFESVSQKSLEEANKPKFNVASSYSDAVDKIQKHGVVAGGYFVLGFDNDDVTIFEDTCDFILHSNLFQSFANVLTPYPGTKLHARMHDEERRIFSDSWEFYNGWTCIYTPRLMSAVELQNGYYWLCRASMSVKYMKKRISRFWNLSAWSDRPKLTPKERFALLVISLRLLSRKEKAYSKFLTWAAFHRNAKDIEFIMWSVMRLEIVEQIQKGVYDNPAERRRELAAGAADAEKN
jgi:radical SAM superfamily enzyme YgiQ (UPF0313 family)